MSEELKFDPKKIGFDDETLVALNGYVDTVFVQLSTTPECSGIQSRLMSLLPPRPVVEETELKELLKEIFLKTIASMEEGTENSDLLFTTGIIRSEERLEFAQEIFCDISGLLPDVDTVPAVPNDEVSEKS